MKIEEDVKMGKENQLYKREFRYVNPGCRCMIEESFDNLDRIKVQWAENVSKKHKFIFVPGGEGFIEEGTEKSVNRETREKIVITSPMTELWELGEYNETYAERLKTYIKKYGFFWPISKDTENVFYSYDLFLIINRLRKLHELFDILALYDKLKQVNLDKSTLNTLDIRKEKSVDYIRLFKLTFFYIFSAHIMLPYEYNKETVLVETCSYDYGDAWWFPTDVQLKSYDINKNAKEINSENEKKNEDIGKTIFCPADNDALRKRHHWIKQKFRDRLAQSRWATHTVSIPYNFSGKYTDEISEAIEFLYNAIPLDSKEGRCIADFLFYFVKNVSKIQMISPDGTVELESKDAFTNPMKFTQCIKDQLVDIAKMVYRKEISWGIQCIAPRFGKNLSYEWEIPSYLSALYFAQFITTSADQELRKCAKPDCLCYFLVNRLNSKFTYHSSACENAMSSQRNRDKKRNMMN